MARDDRPQYYILDAQGEPVAVDDVLTWARWFGDARKRILARDVIRGVLVSTVFLGLDHNWSFTGPPVLWETMIFDSEGSDQYQERYASRASALAGHARALAAIQDWDREVEDLERLMALEGFQKT